MFTSVVVYNGAGEKLDDIKIEIAGIRQPAYTKNGGKFTMNLPAHLTLNPNSAIMANGKQIPKGDFMIKQKKGGIYLKMRILDPVEPIEEPAEMENTTAPASSNTTENTETQPAEFVFEDVDIEMEVEP